MSLKTNDSTTKNFSSIPLHFSETAKKQLNSNFPFPTATVSAMAYFYALRRASSSLLHKSLSLSSHPLSSSSTSFSIISSRHRSSSALFNELVPNSARALVLFYTTTASPPSWADPVAEADDTITIEGCDFEHWLVIMRFPENPKPSEDQMVDTYIKTLAAVVGSEEEAKKKIYSVSTTTYTGFGALVSRELSQGLKALPGVLWVLPDSYLDVPRKDYGGDLLVDGKLLPRPEYRFSKQEPREMVDFNVLDLEDNENRKESANVNEDVDGSFLVSKRLKETIKNVKQSRSEDLEGPAEVTNRGPTKNVETTKVRGTEDLEGRQPMFDGLKETMKTTKREPSHEDLEETADEEETAALFDRLREKMKNVKIEPAKSSCEDSDWPDMWSDKYYEKDEDPRTKLTQEQLDALTVQLQEFKKELMQQKDENKDG